MSQSFEVTTELFGSNVFNLSTMKERLPKDVFKSFKKVLGGEKDLDIDTANVIANAMKDWAIEKGATHYCHWFQPMTGLTAEKHDSFISPVGDGTTVMEFSGKELIQGEPDASSFPSGGLRVTFEARGYTAWDCTSPVFVKEDGKNITLFIPSAFCSYNGQALDKKTPLLRSMDALNKQAVRVLKTLGNTTSSRVTSTLGPEQEYFLVDRTFYEARLDLVLAGRTLFGAPSPRGQEMDDHYFGTLHERVATFMNEINVELWKLGVSAKTQHNEVSPAQYELAPIFATVNVATDHNQLTMETMEKIANRHGFVCLLNEKPFAGVNGSGKHVNWSMGTDDGINLLDPGDTPHSNKVFLVMLTAIIRAVDKYAKLLRASVASTGNDHRLGANEAPPAIISIFLGEQLADVVSQLAEGPAKSSKQGGKLVLGVSTLPELPRDCTDRNRTSPFAFTGNRFEFRMPGSSQSTSGPVFVINTIVAEVLCEFADALEKDASNEAVQALLSKYAKEHERVLFNGDNYSAEWPIEAAKRGLPNLKSTVDALLTINDKENVEVFENQKVLSEEELEARTDILLEAYSMKINIEAKTMIQMAKRQIMPACTEYSASLAEAVASITAAGADASTQKDILGKVCGLIGKLSGAVAALEAAVEKAGGIEEADKQAICFHDDVFAACATVREAADSLEQIVDAEIWPLPTYAEMLFLR
ncbi:MAG: glutamine synthetase III [Phycisphaerae bacterium]|nr:glutamine synthetase III [Phycisphaerae bacterium]